MSIFNIDISISEKRIPEVQNGVLSENTKLSSWGAVYMTGVNSHFFPSSFCIQNNEVVIYIDPIKVESEETADYILITHAHPDHFSLDDIEKISDSNTLIICPKKVAKKLSGYNIKTVYPRDSIEFDNVQIEVVNAYSRGFPSHPKISENVGYIITIDGMRIFHAGDTDKIPEIEKLDNIDVVLVPIDGKNLTMSTQDAALLTNKLKPRIAIPMHYTINMGKANEFRNLVDKEIEVKILAD